MRLVGEPVVPPVISSVLLMFGVSDNWLLHQEEILEDTPKRLKIESSFYELCHKTQELVPRKMGGNFGLITNIFYSLLKH